MAEKKTIGIVTGTGFKCEVDPGCMDDMRVFENIVTLESSDVTEFAKMKAALSIMTSLLGNEQKEALYKHLEETEGQARSISFRRELNDIFLGLSDSKKK